MSSSARRPAPPQPSTRQHPAPPFDWLARPPAPAGGQERRARVACAELAHRAGLLYRLGFTQAEATARLIARTAWEFDPASAPSGAGAHRRPDALSDQAIGKLVAETYARRPG
jgi:hypothetical protein